MLYTQTMNIGLLASLLSIVTVGGGLILQIRKTLVLKKADQLSFGWLILGMITWAGWVAYGVTLDDPYILWANGIGFVLQSLLFGVVWKYRQTKPSTTP